MSPDERDRAAGKGGFTVHLARRKDLAGARAVILEVIERDLGGYRPAVHGDVNDLAGTYLERPRYALFVALDDATGEVVGTTAVRPEPPSSPPHPGWLAKRYSGPTVAQLSRVYIHPAHRRRGIAGALVEAARAWVADEGGYTTIYLHTNAAVPGAEPFWRSRPTTQIYDGRGNHEGYSQAVHFELALPTARGGR
jgi:GNAT superfamily N-acetyltransferase